MKPLRIFVRSKSNTQQLSLKWIQCPKQMRFLSTTNNQKMIPYLWTRVHGPVGPGVYPKISSGRSCLLQSSGCPAACQETSLALSSSGNSVRMLETLGPKFRKLDLTQRHFTTHILKKEAVYEHFLHYPE